MNHDGVVNSDDIALFVAALNGSATDPDILWRADCDSSGSVDGFDIDPFIALLGG